MSFAAASGAAAAAVQSVGVREMLLAGEHLRGCRDMERPDDQIVMEFCMLKYFIQGPLSS